MLQSVIIDDMIPADEEKLGPTSLCLERGSNMIYAHLGEQHACCHLNDIERVIAELAK